MTGRSALVIGTGPIGALAVAVLARYGAAEITAVDVQELPRQIATRLGATRTIDAADLDAISAVEADIVLECSGNARGLASAIRGAARGGTVVLVGMLPSGEQPALISLVISRELDVRGSLRFNNEIDPVLAALADGSLAVDPVITHEFDAADALQAFTVAADAARSGKVLLRF